MYRPSIELGAKQKVQPFYRLAARGIDLIFHDQEEALNLYYNLRGNRAISWAVLTYYPVVSDPIEIESFYTRSESAN